MSQARSRGGDGAAADLAERLGVRRRCPFAELEDAELAAMGITDRRVVIEFDHPEAIKHAVRTGLGVALLFRASVAAELAAGTLREIPIDGVRPHLPVFVVWRADKRLSPLHHAVLDTIRHDVATAPR